MADEIKRVISDEPVLKTKRIARHESFVILPDLEMYQQIRVEEVINNAGQTYSDLIRADDTLTDAQKEVYLAQFGGRIVTRQTDGAFVNPATGAVVPDGTAGSIPQSQFMQGITIGMLKAQGMPINDNFPVLQIIYAMLAGEIGKIDARGGLNL